MGIYVLDQLWKGQVTPNDRSISNNSHYSKLISQLLTLETSFCEELSVAGKQHYQDYCETQMELSGISEQDAFIRGVRLGAQFILDVTGTYQAQLLQTRELTEEEKQS